MIAGGPSAVLFIVLAASPSTVTDLVPLEDRPVPVLAGAPRRSGLPGRSDARRAHEGPEGPDGVELRDLQERLSVYPVRRSTKSTGSIDPTVIRGIVRSHTGQIEDCYEQGLKAAPGLRGKVVMKWVIGAAGTVKRSETSTTELKNADVERRSCGGFSPRPKAEGLSLSLIRSSFDARMTPREKTRGAQRG